jgi:hypothetical protein
MKFKKFIENIEKIYADQGNKPKGERLRYGQIIMNELWQVWPQKYRQIVDSNKDCFYCDVLDKKPYDLFDELEKEWPVFPAKIDNMKYKFIHKPSPEQVRIQRLEKKIKKLQASNKRNKEDIKYYKRMVRDFPWIEPTAQTIQENIELKKTLKEKNWALRHLEETMNVTQILNDDDMDILINLAYNNPAVEKVLRVIKYLRNSKK